jgi:hypothetical protein
MMFDTTQRYCSYLLRIWRSGAADSSHWLASLEDTRTGERHGFASLAAAFAFLEAQTAAQAGATKPVPDTMAG